MNDDPPDADATADAADLLPDAHWGTAETPLPEVVEDDTPDPDDEELPETPPDVIAMLGFDPLDAGDADGEQDNDATLSL